MAITYSTRGTPTITCPNCGRHHPIQRKGAYAERPPKRFHCRHCKTSWHATEEEQQAVMTAAAALRPKAKSDAPQQEKLAGQEADPPKRSGLSKLLWGGDE